MATRHRRVNTVPVCMLHYAKLIAAGEKRTHKEVNGEQSHGKLTPLKMGINVSTKRKPAVASFVVLGLKP